MEEQGNIERDKDFSHACSQTDRYASLSNNTPSHSRHENLRVHSSLMFFFSLSLSFFCVIKKQMGKAEKDSEREGGCRGGRQF